MNSSFRRVFLVTVSVALILSLMKPSPSASKDRFSFKTAAFTAGDATNYFYQIDVNSTVWSIGNTYQVNQSLIIDDIGAYADVNLRLRFVEENNAISFLSNATDNPNSAPLITDTNAFGRFYHANWSIPVDNTFPSNFFITVRSSFSSPTPDPSDTDWWILASIVVQDPEPPNTTTETVTDITTTTVTKSETSTTTETPTVVDTETITETAEETRTIFTTNLIEITDTDEQTVVVTDRKSEVALNFVAVISGIGFFVIFRVVRKRL